MKLLKNYLVLFAIAGTVIIFDQYTKWLVRTNLALGEMWLPDALSWLLPYARIVHWYNHGAAFGMFQGGSWVFAGLAVIVIGVIIYYFPQVDDIDWWLKLALALQLAGAGGNLIDRILFKGRVTDFISVGTFPVWNVADSAITIGVVILVLGVAWKEMQLKKQSKTEASSGESVPVEPPTDEESGSGTEEGSGE